MNWTQKETDLLKDLKTQEAICVAKYGCYAQQAQDPELQQLFRTIQKHEQQHLQTVTGMLEDRIPAGYAPQEFIPPEESAVPAYQECPVPDKQTDAYLCQDALSMEKHVSGVYDTSIFEFCSPAARQTLSEIQTQEQWHGEQLYAYMSRNGMIKAN